MGSIKHELDDPFWPMRSTDAAWSLTEWEQRLSEEREGRDLPPEPGDGDPACPFCDSTSGFESVGFGSDGPERCKACGHTSHESER